MPDRRIARLLSGTVLVGLGALVVFVGIARPVVSATPPSEESKPGESKRVVAIGDIHGALEPLREILRAARLIDERDRWIGGDTVLVQIGDFLDRGSKVREVVALLRDLQDQAAAAGGRVIVLLGNHEALNLVHDLRDVNERIVRHYAERNAEARRTVYCREVSETVRRRARAAGAEPPDRVALHSRCLEETPLGWLEYLDALGPEGELGAWLRTLPAATRVGDVLFVHGGVSPALADVDLETINDQVREEIAAFDAIREELLDREAIFPTSQLVEIYRAAQALEETRPRAIDTDLSKLTEWFLIAPEGPLWFRGYAQWSDEEGRAELPAILEAQSVDAVVVGHTPQTTRRIEPRFGNLAYLIDTGMLENVYGGRPSALEFVGDRVTAIYADDQEVLPAP